MTDRPCPPRIYTEALQQPVSITPSHTNHTSYINHTSHTNHTSQNKSHLAFQPHPATPAPRLQEIKSPQSFICSHTCSRMPKSSSGVHEVLLTTTAGRPSLGRTLPSCAQGSSCASDNCHVGPKFLPCGPPSPWVDASILRPSCGTFLAHCVQTRAPIL